MCNNLQIKLTEIIKVTDFPDNNECIIKVILNELTVYMIILILTHICIYYILYIYIYIYIYILYIISIFNDLLYIYSYKNCIIMK